MNEPVKMMVRAPSCETPPEFRVWGLGFRGWGLGVGVSVLGLGVRVLGLGVGGWVLGFR